MLLETATIVVHKKTTKLAPMFSGLFKLFLKASHDPLVSESMELISIPNGFLKNVKASPKKNLLAIPQNGSKVHVLQVDGTLTCTIYTLNETNCISWFPFQTDVGVLAAASNDRPIVLYNTNDGTEICSYLTMNHIEQIDAPLAMDFIHDASRLVCGGFESVRMFDIQRPGKEHDLIKLSPTRASKEGLKGRVSALTVRQDSSQIAALGTFNDGGLGIMDLKSHQLIFESTGRLGSVQQIAFSEDGWSMYTYSRRSERILCWDLRSMAIRSEILRPNMNTNQRLHFDLYSNDLIAFGDSIGNVYINSASNGESVYNSHICENSISGVSFIDANTIVCCNGDRHSTMDSRVQKINFK